MYLAHVGFNFAAEKEEEEEEESNWPLAS